MQIEGNHIQINTLRETIEAVLSDVHIDDGTEGAHARVVDRLEAAISQRILGHAIDIYSERMKT